MPGLVDSAFTAWLKAPALYASGTNGSLPAGLNDAARDQEIISSIYNLAGANAELARQVAFLAGPLARDVAIVRGAHVNLIGRAINLTCDLLGYEVGPLVFVIGVDERDDGLSEITVLRRLN